MLHDAGGHFEQGLVAALQALQEPARLLEMIAQEGVVRAVVRALHEPRVVGVDSQSRRCVGVELHQPAPLFP